MLVLEALRAKYGDALLLHYGTPDKPRLAVIDGGPPGVYSDALKPRLDEIRQERKLAANQPLEIDLMMVSHIDADHIAGILDLVRKLKDLRDSQQPVPWRIRRFWHNSFDDIIGNDDVSVASAASVMSTASIGGLLGHEGSLVLASVGQGRDLRKLLDALNLDGNPPFGGLVKAGHDEIALGNLQLTIVAPLEENLLELQKDWDKKIKPILQKEKDAAARAEAAAYVDKSVYNLSSIVVLVEGDGKRLLLTGDGRGDHTLQGLAQAGLLDDEGKIEVDVLKMPHHGSVRNIDAGYFATIRAQHYVISADGKFDNPDLETLELISQARPDDDFTIHLTYPTGEFNVPEIGEKVAQFIAGEKAAGRKYEVETRQPGDLSLRLALA
jgi:hypothetical protein